MRPGGILDRFPVHLIASGNQDLPLLILDDSDLGRLQVVPVSGARNMVVVLSKGQACLKNTRNSAGLLNGSRFRFVQGDPDRLPFRNRSISGIIKRSPVKPKKVENSSTKYICFIPMARDHSFIVKLGSCYWSE